MIPGSVQAVRKKKRYIQKRQKKKTIGSAGVTFQLSPTTNMQKGITAMRVQI